MPRVSAAERDAKQDRRLKRLERERAIARGDDERWAATEPAGDYRAGFLAGYLRAFADGDEYACSVETAVRAFGRFLREGARGEPLRDVDGW
jgi:hypothetical protein